MKKITLTSILALCMVCPAMADIAKEATSATCDNATIGTTTGPANLQADWTANTINLEWYSNGEQLDVATASDTCTYDHGITLPSTPTIPTGYTFGGWQLRRAPAAPSAPQQTSFDLSTLAQYMDETGGTRYYQRRNNSTGAAECRHNASGSFVTVDCSDPLVSDLTMSEWKEDFTYGTVKGEAICSTVDGTYAGQTGSPTDDLDLNNLNNGARYCWCGATAFDAEKDGSFLPVASSSWVFDNDYDNAVSCAHYCASDCASYVQDDSEFRQAVFGITE